MDDCIKQEPCDTPNVHNSRPKTNVASTFPDTVIELSSSSSDSDSDVDLDSLIGTNIVSAFSRGETGTRGASVANHGGILKKRKTNEGGIVLPLGFLSPLPSETSQPTLRLPAPELPSTSIHANGSRDLNVRSKAQSCKQFWKAGDYEGAISDGWDSSSVGMDHVRVHPKFLHSNATSHKWALGAFAELLDNSLDEVCNGATFVNVDMVVNKKDDTRMLLVEDNGGGMDPDKMRQCMSLGYSVKSKLANTIGQYGNGFKTSTMRLGADVIVFSRWQGKEGKSSTQSIGLLSYTFLRGTGKEDIVVPMLDYERGGQGWNRMIRSSWGDWNKNVETIIRWSPFSSEEDLLRQFNMMKAQGTRIIIYNLWEDDQGQLELDFDADPHDIQIRGVNREEKHIEMAREFPNSRHFLTYRHSLRSYASILYLRLPPGFRIILRGKDVVHHNIVNDMMMSQEVTYRPQAGIDGVPKDLNMVAVVTIGFVKDAVHHIDVSGFNVYHKNRLIKPFWRIWNPAGSGGRGVIGVLEANFVEPAHDKQGFERTIVLSRLETRLIQMQRSYWNSNRHKIGYASNHSNNPQAERANRETSPDYTPGSSQSKGNTLLQAAKPRTASDKEEQKGNIGVLASSKRSGKKQGLYELSISEEENSDEDQVVHPKKLASEEKQKIFQAEKSLDKEDSFLQDITSSGRTFKFPRGSKPKGKDVSECHYRTSDPDLCTLEQLKEENRDLKERLSKMEEEIIGELRRDLQRERDKCKSLETQLQAAEKTIEELNKEQETIIDVFTEERDRRDAEEKKLRKKLQEASDTIEELRDKVRLQEKRLSSGKLGR
ncbi:LOW QUALITY PROTEIN: protein MICRORCHIDIA 7-like [Prosopis cineraria]|uniref:LOW QUALITY PROTEIN: protein MICRORCHIDIA 7-like n=1 Tax=Prosopis cineraria TaxID=364024 RepID=UPI0024102610|nr:LOW QUALITY PROTEIN: protein MICRORCHIDIA 7-like [Prosopis cineraria]